MSIYRLLFALFVENSNPHYLKRYLKLIEVYKTRDSKKQKGFHSHHIIPKNLSGGECKGNKVIVCPKEHFVLHWILDRAFPNTGMVSAFKSMCNGWGHCDFRINSKTYERVMLEFGERQSSLLKGVPRGPESAETRQKKSDALKGRPSGMKGVSKSEEMKKNLSDSTKGVPKSNEHRQALSNALKGKPNGRKGILMSEEQKKTISDTKKNAPKKECPHCHRMFNSSSFTRYHGDKCKEKK